MRIVWNDGVSTHEWPDVCEVFVESEWDDWDNQEIYSVGLRLYGYDSEESATERAEQLISLLKSVENFNTGVSNGRA